MSLTSERCFPAEFLCEHTASRSRVFVRLVALHLARPIALKAVLTCADAELADRAAEVLNLVGEHPICRELAASIEKAMPAAPAASFREALSRAQRRAWPISDMRPAASPGRDRAASVTIREGPDFAALFRVEEHDCDAGCSPSHLTPRTADLLYAALTVLADEAYDDIAEYQGEPVDSGDGIEWSVFARLPEFTWREGVDWRREFARSCDDLAADLASGGLPAPRCEAEQMALLLAIADAPDFKPRRGRILTRDAAECSEQSPADAAHEVLPRYRWDYDWMGCVRLLSRSDHIVLVYITSNGCNPDAGDDGDSDADRSDGGDSDGGSDEERGFTGDEWFAWFSSAEPRDPDRGFRR